MDTKTLQIIAAFAAAASGLGAIVAVVVGICKLSIERKKFEENLKHEKELASQKIKPFLRILSGRQYNVIKVVLGNIGLGPAKIWKCEFIKKGGVSHHSLLKVFNSEIIKLLKKSKFLNVPIVGPNEVDNENNYPIYGLDKREEFPLFILLRNEKKDKNNQSKECKEIADKIQKELELVEIKITYSDVMLDKKEILYDTLYVEDDLGIETHLVQD